MNTRRFISAFVALLITATAARAAAPEGWTEDYAKALAQAKTEHKKVFLDFTGSDWCKFCKMIDAEVFDQQKFKDYAAKHFVLVKVDFPNSDTLSAEIKKQNFDLKDKYGVTGFPTLIVVGLKGKKTWEHVGYLEGGPDAFIKALESKGK